MNNVNHRYTGIKQKKKKRTIFVNHEDRRHRISLAMIFTIILVLVAGLGAALPYAMIYNTQIQITRTMRLLAEQRELNINTRADMVQRYTLDEVDRIATDRLGMSLPDESKTIKIHVPKQSHVVLNDDDFFIPIDYRFLPGIADFVKSYFDRFID